MIQMRSRKKRGLALIIIAGKEEQWERKWLKVWSKAATISALKSLQKRSNILYRKTGRSFWRDKIFSRWITHSSATRRGSSNSITAAESTVQRVQRQLSRYIRVQLRGDSSLFCASAVPQFCLTFKGFFSCIAFLQHVSWCVRFYISSQIIKKSWQTDHASLARCGRSGSLVNLAMWRDWN